MRACARRPPLSRGTRSRRFGACADNVWQVTGDFPGELTGEAEIESTTDVVRAPFTDRPALSDPTTAILLRNRERQRTLNTFLLVPQGLLLGFALIINVATGDLQWIRWGGSVLTLSLLLVARRLMFSQLSARKRLLAEQAWRPVAARVVRAGRWWPTCRIELTDGDSTAVLVVMGAHRAHSAVIARTGTVWMVGDIASLAVVRVDGSHEPWHAKRPRRARSPKPMTGEMDPTKLWASRLRNGTVSAWSAVGCVAVIGAAVGVWAVPGRPWAMLVFVLATVALIIAAVAFATHRHPLLHRLPELVEAGEWSVVQASLRPWKARMDDSAEASAVIRLGDGRTMTADMRSASVDLLGTVWDTGTLWFAGEPEPGKTMAAGYPGYPLLAVAVIR